jgi:hypothetical protein
VIKAELQVYLEAMEEPVKIHAEDVETRLLSAFWNWAKTADAVPASTATVAAFSERLEYPPERIDFPCRRLRVWVWGFSRDAGA